MESSKRNPSSRSNATSTDEVLITEDELPGGPLSEEERARVQSFAYGALFGERCWLAREEGKEGELFVRIVSGDVSAYGAPVARAGLVARVGKGRHKEKRICPSCGADARHRRLPDGFVEVGEYNEREARYEAEYTFKGFRCISCAHQWFSD